MIEVLIQSERRGERNWEFIARVVRVGRGVEAGAGGGVVGGMGGPGGAEGADRADGVGEAVGVGGIGGAGGRVSLHVLALDWADYEYWRVGGASPSVVASAVLRVLDRLRPEYELPERFDCSLARRLVPGFDSGLRAELGGVEGGADGLPRL